MRVYEVLQLNEDKQQLDELAPLIAVPVLMAAASAALTTYFVASSTMAIWDILDAKGFELKALTADDWSDITVEVLTAILPFGIGPAIKMLKGGLTNPVFKKLTDMVKNGFAKKTNNFDKTTRVKSTPKTKAQRKVQAKKATEAAKQKAAQEAAAAQKAATTAGKVNTAKKVAKYGGGAVGVATAIAGRDTATQDREQANKKVADYKANRQAGQAFGANADPSVNWDPLGTMSKLNKKYGN